MNWHKVPEFETVSSTADDNPFAGARSKPTGKVSVKLSVDDWLCRKMSSLNLTLTEGYPTRNTDNTGHLRDQFIKTPRSSRWYGMHAEKDSENSTVRTWSPDPAKLNHSFSRVARRNLPTVPPSRAFSQDLLKRWERAAREQTIMCNQIAGLSRCLTRVQDSIATQLKTLSLDSKGKSSEKMKQAVNELEYLTTFNRSISQAMARTMQDLAGVFINMANFTLARRDSYLDYLHSGVKQDTVNALRTSPVHLNALFPDQLIAKAEEEISKNERGVRLVHHTGCNIASTLTLQVTSLRVTTTGNLPSRLGSRLKTSNKPGKVVAKPQHSPRSRPRGSSFINDNHCVIFCDRSELCKCYRSGRLEPSTSCGREQQSDFKIECRLSCCKCSYCHRVATKERRKSHLLSNVHRNKICEKCFLCRSLEFCKSCQQCPTCCYRSSCRGKVTPVLGEMGSSGFESKSSHHTEGGLHPTLPVQTPLNKVTYCNKPLPQLTQAVLPDRGTVSADKQERSRTGTKSKLTGFLQPAIFGTQTQQPVETGPGPEHLEHLFEHRVVQDGDPRDNKNLPTGKGVGHIHRLQRRILPHPNSRSVQEVHAFSSPGSVLPVQGPTLWSIHSSNGIHSGGQRDQTHCTSEGYKDPPVPR